MLAPDEEMAKYVVIDESAVWPGVCGISYHHVLQTWLTVMPNSRRVTLCTLGNEKSSGTQARFGFGSVRS